LMADLASGTVGFLTSTMLIVIFGEIIPQAGCSRYALQVGAMTVPLVKVMMYSPIYLFTKPLSMALDWALGKEMGTVHSRTELMEMLKLQIHLGAVDAAEGEMAKQVAEGALSFRDKRVEEVMTPIKDAYMLSTEVRLDYEMIRKIFETGYSRIPVYGKDKHDYKGLLYTKDLMLADPEDAMKLGDFIQIFQRKVETFFKHTKLVEILSIFKKGGTHMGLVRVPNTEESTNPRFEIVGLLSLEDVVEEILQDEIVDETDVFVEIGGSRVRVSDGRALRELNLGVFNPVWRVRGDRLAREEIQAISKHLRSTIFTRDGSLELSPLAVEWIVMSSELRSMDRQTPVGVMQPYEADILFRRGVNSERCIFILQGKVGAQVGREGFRSELGAFSVLGKAALYEESFAPDFDAYLLTTRGRILSISKSTFAKALELDRDKGALEIAIRALAEEAAGETSRKETLPITRGGGLMPRRDESHQDDHPDFGRAGASQTTSAGTDFARAAANLIGPAFSCFGAGSAGAVSTPVKRSRSMGPRDGRGGRADIEGGGLMGMQSPVPRAELGKAAADLCGPVTCFGAGMADRDSKHFKG